MLACPTAFPCSNESFSKAFLCALSDISVGIESVPSSNLKSGISPTHLKYGNIQLHVVSITMKADAVPPDDVPKWKHVKIKKSWT